MMIREVPPKETWMHPNAPLEEHRDNRYNGQADGTDKDNVVRETLVRYSRGRFTWTDARDRSALSPFILFAHFQSD